MNSWPTWATVVTVVVPVLGLLNAWLLVQIKVEITSLKLEMLQQRITDRDELRDWVETEYLRRAEIDARFSEIRGRIDRIEHSRRREDRAA